MRRPETSLTICRPLPRIIQKDDLMKALTCSLLISASLLSPLLLRAEDAKVAEDKVLRDKAVAWVIAHTGKDSDTGIVQNMTKIIDTEITKRHNLSLRFGSGLTVSGKMEQMWLFTGQLLGVQFTDEQAEQLDKDRMSVSSESHLRREKIAETRAARLSSLKIDNASSLNGSQKITGSVSCKTLNPMPKKFALRLSYFTGESSITGFFYLENSLPDDGKLTFTFVPINEPDAEKKFSGPLVVFVDLCDGELNSDQPSVIYSNAVGAVLDVAKP
jgi:hypothetical protein